MVWVYFIDCLLFSVCFFVYVVNSVVYMLLGVLDGFGIYGCVCCDVVCLYVLLRLKI